MDDASVPFVVDDLPDGYHTNVARVNGKDERADISQYRGDDGSIEPHPHLPVFVGRDDKVVHDYPLKGGGQSQQLIQQGSCHALLPLVVRMQLVGIGLGEIGQVLVQ